MRSFCFFIICFYSCLSYGQIVNPNYVSKTIVTSKDTLSLEPVAISSIDFQVKDSNNQIIPPSYYFVNFQTGKFYFFKENPESIVVNYFKYPSFLTKSYSPFDPKLIIPRATPEAKTYSLKNTYTKSDFFGDVDTYGNITRGITVGNNQGSVLNSGLDLQITGNLTEKLKLRASIKDSNLPLQENGISQSINEFDRVFIELFTQKWNIKAGDVDLQNKDSYFLNFTKKINGAKLNIDLGDETQQTNINVAGALVRGKFKTQNITAQEGNQGPYLLKGINNELNIVVISGSETVYVNGIVLKRGEQNDYTVDYNTAEISFNSTFPINSTQRIIVDFQYNDQNYNRFITHNGVSFKNDKIHLSTYFYQENDIKSQSIQQNLEEEQIEILSKAGNNTDLMVSASAIESELDENRIQYLINDNNVFEQSVDETQILYNVTFSFIGDNAGDYILRETVASGNIYEYVAPVNGIKQGNYAPLVQLFAPTQTQMAIVKAGYQVHKNSFINTEFAYSNNDDNLFSNIGDEANKGWANTLIWKYESNHKKRTVSNLLEADFVHQNFKNIEGLYKAEFNRDWNLDTNILPNNLGNQTYIRNAFVVEKEDKYKIALANAYLNLSNGYKGFKNGIVTENSLDKIKINTNSSFLSSKNNTEKGSFLRHQTSAKYQAQKITVQALVDYEKNTNTNHITQVLDTINSQKNIKTSLVLSLGDSTKVYSKLGYSITQIDSVKTNALVRVQNAQNYSLESQWIKNEKTEFNTYVNYRIVDNLFLEDNKVLNARTLFGQKLFNNTLRLNTLYETSSGSTFQQNYAYVETEVGQGYYTYLGDLNENGLKDFDEFEIAPYTDQANYLRVLLPNTTSLSTQKAKLNQSLYLNFSKYAQHESSWVRFWSHFSNQSTILIEKDQLKKEDKFNINPFQKNGDDIVALQQNITTSMFFNRGLQKFSTTYSYQDSQNTQNTINDVQVASLQKHKIAFQHNIQSSWLLKNDVSYEENKNTSVNFTSRNYHILSRKTNPSLSFLKNQYSSIQTSYLFRNEKNTIGTETLLSHDFGLNFSYNQPKKKASMLASVSWIENNYEGESNTPAAFKILQGLQPDRNYTWSLILQKDLTKMLNLSINYNGRSNDSTRTIHVGSVQLRANF